MKLNNFHLSYCSNIHPGESWDATFKNLKTYIPEVRKRLKVTEAFGIGLRLSNEASLILKEPEKLKEFKAWLTYENAYVFTLNGFPYGDFHRQVVKEKVHFPDWTTTDRRDYTIRSFRILAELLPEDMDGGISTSPISYRHWFKTQEELEQAMKTATQNLLDVVVELATLEKETGKLLHLDIEPEPDGILENSDEMIWLFTDWLIPRGIPFLCDRFGISMMAAEEMIKRHIQVCYDVCHFAIVYEDPEETFSKFHAAGIQVGKIQISAALKVLIPESLEAKLEIIQKLQPFAESTYLHQVVGRDQNQVLTSYSDLPEAIEKLSETKDEEWRIHFHVPIFLEDYGALASTQSAIKVVLNQILKNPHITNHLEVETYTWEVLPEDTKLTLGESISRELAWVIENMS
jgi:hypothetical protein